MKNIKDITLSIFAIIGFVAILSSFNNQTQQTHSTVPESHVWDAVTSSGNNVYIFNKVNGEIRGLGDAPVKDGIYDVMKRRN